MSQKLSSAAVMIGALRIIYKRLKQISGERSRATWHSCSENVVCLFCLLHILKCTLEFIMEANTLSSQIWVCTVCNIGYQVHLRNEFDFWKVHGIMNTLGLLQSKKFARDPKYS